MTVAVADVLAASPSAKPAKGRGSLAAEVREARENAGFGSFV